MNWFYIFKGDGSPLYSREFPRGGLAAIFGMHVWQVLNTPTVTITVEGRNRDDTTFTPLGVFASITTGGIKTLDQGGLLEILRFKFEVAGATSLAGAAIETLAPQWRMYT